MSQEPWAELGETVSAIRAQLQQALEEGKDEPLRFRTGPVQLEFSIEVRKEGEAKAKILVLPWSAEVRAGASAGQVHRIRLTLQPVEGSGGDLLIAGTSARPPE
jgi:Trypsin-co-occurring domain 2